MRCLIAPLLLVALVPAATPAQERTLTLGRTVQDVLRDTDPIGRSRRAPYHIWTFEGRRGQRVTFELNSRDFDAWIGLRDADGYLIGSDDDSGDGTDARVRAILPRDGRYRIVATAFSESGRGFYTITARPWDLPEAPAPGQVASLRAGETRTGVLEPGDEVSGDAPFQDRWTVDARSGQRLQVDLRSEDFDAWVQVLDAEGRELVNDDDGLGGRDASAFFRAAEAGRYTIVASSYGDSPQTGVYTITLIEESDRDGDPGTPATLTPGTLHTGRLESGDRRGSRGYEDQWTFTGRAGQLVRIDVMSDDFDAMAALRFDGDDITTDDDGGDGTNARISTTLSRDGRYTLAVYPFSESRRGGRYRVQLTFRERSAGAGRVERIEPGRRQVGRLEAGDETRGNDAYQDVWEFEGRSDQDVSIEMIANDFDAYLELRDDRGVLIAEDDDGGDGTNSFLVTRLPRSGRYRIIARSFGDSERTGEYDLTLTVAATTSGGTPGRVAELQLDQMLAGRLDPGDSVMGDGTWADVYTFRAPRDGDLVVDMRSSDFDAYLIARDDEDQILGTDDDGGSATNARLVIPVRRGRSYRIYANSYGTDASRGAYQLSARLER